MDYSETLQQISGELDSLEASMDIGERSVIRRFGLLQANLDALGGRKGELEPKLRGSLAQLEARFWSLLDDCGGGLDPLEELKGDWEKARDWMGELGQAVEKYRGLLSCKSEWKGKDWSWDELEKAGQDLDHYYNEEFQATFDRLEALFSQVLLDPGTGEVCECLLAYDALLDPSRQVGFGQLSEHGLDEFVRNPGQFKATGFANLEELYAPLYADFEQYNSEYAAWEDLYAKWEAGNIAQAVACLGAIQRFSEIQDQAKTLLDSYRENLEQCKSLKVKVSALKKAPGRRTVGDLGALIRQVQGIKEYGGQLPDALRVDFELGEEEKLLSQYLADARESLARNDNPGKTSPVPSWVPKEEKLDLDEALKGTGIAGLAARHLANGSMKLVSEMLKDPKFQAAAKRAADARKEQEDALDKMFGTTDPARVEKAALEYSKDHDARKMHAGEFIKGLAKYRRENA